MPFIEDAMSVATEVKVAGFSSPICYLQKLAAAVYPGIHILRIDVEACEISPKRRDERRCRVFASLWLGDWRSSMNLIKLAS
jgi:hypothetical protein